MAQNFRRYLARNVGTSAVTLHTANSYDTVIGIALANTCLLYTSPSPRDVEESRMPSSA